MDYLDQLVAEAVRQGWHVWQDRSGAWIFQQGKRTVIQPADTPADLLDLLSTLRGAGRVLPAETPLAGGIPVPPASATAKGTALSMTDWTAIIKGRTDRPLSIDAQLAVSAAGTVRADADTGYLEITTHAVAPSLAAATAAARIRVESACRDADVTAEWAEIRVLADDAFAAEVMQPPGADLLGIKEAAEVIGVTRQRAAQLAAEREDFPPPVAKLAMGPVYTRQSIELFAERWPRQRTGRPRKDASAA